MMRFYRRPKTIQEKRAGDAAEVEPRGKRKPASLPSNWDDIPRASFADRCWKRFRKTKWRVIADK